jgi:hypothetical protein
MIGSKNKILNMAKTLKVNSALLPSMALDSPPQPSNESDLSINIFKGRRENKFTPL